MIKKYLSIALVFLMLLLTGMGVILASPALSTEHTDEKTDTQTTKEVLETQKVEEAQKKDNGIIEDSDLKIESTKRKDLNSESVSTELSPDLFKNFGLDNTQEINTFAGIGITFEEQFPNPKTAEAVAGFFGKQPAEQIDADNINVDYINISNKGLTDLTGIDIFSKLEFLNVNNNFLDNSQIHKILALPKLLYLYIDNNKLTDISAFKNFLVAPGSYQEYAILSVAGNYITDISFLNDIPSLPGYTVLVLANNQIKDFSPVSHFPNFTFYASDATSQIINENKIKLYSNTYTIDFPYIQNEFPSINYEINHGGYLKDGKIIWDNIPSNATELTITYSASVPYFYFDVTYNIPLSFVHELSFDLNGGKEPTADVQLLTEGEKAVKVQNPSRDGYIFVGWNTQQDGNGADWNFNSSTMPNENLTLYAQWKSIPTTSTPTTQTPTTSSPTTKAPTASNPVVTETTQTETSEETGALATFKTVETTKTNTEFEQDNKEIDANKTPLGTLFNRDHWSLANLIIAIGCGIISIFVFISVFIKKDSKQDNEDKNKRIKLWKTVGVILGVVAVAIFLLTQNMSDTMVMFDLWTPIMVIIATSQIVAIVLANAKRKDHDNQKFSQSN